MRRINARCQCLDVALRGARQQWWRIAVLFAALIKVKVILRVCCASYSWLAVKLLRLWLLSGFIIFL